MAEEKVRKNSEREEHSALHGWKWEKFKDQRKVSGAQGRLPGSSKETDASVLQMQELDSANNLNEKKNQRSR